MSGGGACICIYEMHFVFKVIALLIQINIINCHFVPYEIQNVSNKMNPPFFLNGILDPHTSSYSKSVRGCLKTGGEELTWRRQRLRRTGARWDSFTFYYTHPHQGCSYLNKTHPMPSSSQISAFTEVHKLHTHCQSAKN